MIRRLSFVALALLAAGCSGGGTGSVPAALSNAPANGTASTAGTANAQVQITIPAPPSTASARRAQFVSPATQSLSFALAGGTPIVVALTAGSPGCTTTANVTTCTANVPLPIGANQQFLVSTFASADGTGTALSVTKVTATIISGQANPITLTLGGIPKTVVLSAQATAIPTVAATSIPVTVTVKDASGNTIVGDTPFSDANGNAVSIALANSDTSGATTISPATLTAPGTASVAYDGYFQPTSTTITASGTGLTAATATLTFAAKTIVLGNSGNAALTLTANSGIESIGTNRHAAAARRSAQSVSIINTLAALVPTGNAATPYALGTHSSASPSGFTTLCNGCNSFGMATASNGHLYISERATQWGLFDAGTTPTWPGTGTVIAGSGTHVFGGLALGPGGKMYAAITGGFEQINPATGAAIGSPVTTSAAQFQQTIPNAIAVGPDGAVYIEAFAAGGGGDEVLVFTPSGSGFVFARAFWTANSNNTGDAIYGLAVDATNHVYISEDSYGTIDVVPASSSGNVLPSMVYSNNNNIDDGNQLVIDRAGNIIWATYSTVSIYGPNTGSVPPGGTNPANTWFPVTDTAALQTVTSTVSDFPFNDVTFGPGS